MSKRRKWSSAELARERSLSVNSRPAFSNEVESDPPKIRKKSHIILQKRQTRRNPTADRRIIINVKGKRFETYVATLNNYPDTLLGCEQKREKYFDIMTGEIVLKRDQEIFEAVLFYYQSNGILAKPSWVSESDFNRELLFYELVKTPEKVVQKHRYNICKLIWNMMEYPRSSPFALTLAVISIITITLSLVIFCAETVPEIAMPKDKDEREYNHYILFCLETCVIVWFTLEYTLRVISSPAKLKFLFSFLGVVDVIVILPFYIDIIMTKKNRVYGFYVIRIIRMVRVFRIFKLTRYSTGLKVLGKTIVESCGQLVALFLCLLLSAIIFASTIFYLETANDTEGKSNFKSIPDVFWYVFITMTTVGYGDVIPQTILGKISAAFCMVTGIIVLLCLPTPVFITHFGRFYEDVVNRRPEEEEDEDKKDTEEKWHLTDRALLVPTWFNDDSWKERIRNDNRMTLFMPSLNIYLSNPNIKKATSMEILTHYDDVHR